MEGTVKFFNKIKGFGFITGDDGKDYFVHLSNIKDQKYIVEGQRVTFDAIEDEKGLKAENVGPSESEAPVTEEPAEEQAEEAAEEASEEPEAEEAPVEEEAPAEEPAEEETPAEEPAEETPAEEPAEETPAEEPAEEETPAEEPKEE